MAGEITYSPGAPNDAFACGTYTVDASATAYIACGFQPRKIKLTNLTDDCQVFWVYGMDSASYFKQVAVASGAVVASGGPAVDAGQAEGLDDAGDAQSARAEGFTIPGGIVNLSDVNDQVVIWEAWR